MVDLDKSRYKDVVHVFEQDETFFSCNCTLCSVFIQHNNAQILMLCVCVILYSQGHWKLSRVTIHHDNAST